jgi:transposase
LLTPGNCADITTAYELAAQLPSNGCLIGDMGYDALELRQTLAFQGTATVIPTNPTHKHKWPIDLQTYKERNLVERMFGRLTLRQARQQLRLRHCFGCRRHLVGWLSLDPSALSHSHCRV